MKSIIRLKTIVNTCVLILILLYSCNKEDDSSLDNLIVYTTPGNSTYNISTGELFTTLEGSEVPQALSIGLTITRPNKNDVTVTAEIDTNLIREYDKLKGVVSKRYDLSKFELTKSQIVINAGDIHSSEKFTIKLKSDNKIEINEPCVIPIRVVALGDISTSVNRSVMYLVITGQKKITGSFETVFQKLNSLYSSSEETFTKIGFPIRLNMSLLKVTKMSVSYDKSLVDEYNKKHNTKFLKVPDGLFNIINNEVSVKVGDLLSFDSIKIEFSDIRKFELGKSYLIPIKINNNESVFVSEESGVKYLEFIPVINNIVQNNTSLIGSKMDRKDWKLLSNIDFDPFVVQNIIDGNYETPWIFSRPAWLQLDMGATKTLKGFTFVPNYSYDLLELDILEMDISVSDNGTDWVSIGKYFGTPTNSNSSTTNPDVKTIKFNTPVTTRYFKFEIIAGSDSQVGAMSELYGIE